MARLIYSSITSLDGYVSDEKGSFDWGVPDDEVHRFVNELGRPVGTYLFGRRIYEVMKAWDTMQTEGEPAVMQEFAAGWRQADKIVYSTTLSAVSGARTRLEGSFSPDAVAQLVAGASRDLAIGGPGLAAQALRAGLVDEIHQLVSPVVVGAGTHFLPAGLRMPLTLLDERRFRNGVVFLRYGTQDAGR
jgi:dihydrofolate reductase